MLNTDFAIGFGMVYVYLPLMVLPIYASMEKLDFRMVEAGYDLYATPLGGAAADHHPAGEARHHRRLHPGVHPRARRLCDAGSARRRQEDDDQQPDLAAIRPGPQLAVGRGALHHADGDRDGGLARLCAGTRRAAQRGDIRVDHGGTDASHSSSIACRASAPSRSPCSSLLYAPIVLLDRLLVQRAGIAGGLGRILLALVRGRLAQPRHQGSGVPLALAGWPCRHHRDRGGDLGGASPPRAPSRSAA